MGAWVLCSAAPISFHCILEVSEGSGCMVPISQLRKGQRPQVGLAIASLTAATADCGPLSRTVPRGGAAGGRPAEGSRELQRLGLCTTGLGPPGLAPTSGQWLLILLEPRAAQCVLLRMWALEEGVRA